jgi:hypothetical protein
MTLFVNYKAVCDACGAMFKEESYELSSARFVLPEPNVRRNQIADVLACDACVRIATAELVKIKLKENK